MIPYLTHSIVKLGLIHIPMSPVLNTVGILVALWFVLKISKRFNVKPQNMITIFVLATLLGVGIGSRIFFYFGPWGTNYTLAERFINLFNFAKPGMVYYGGFLTTIIVILIYCIIAKVNFRNHINLFTIATPLAQFFGRIGCYLHGCCFGKITTSEFALENLHSGTIRYPTQLMLSFNALILFIIIYSLSKKKPHLLFPIYLILYSTTRFIIEFYRSYSWNFLSLTFSQWISIYVFIAGTIILYRWQKHPI